MQKIKVGNKTFRYSRPRRLDGGESWGEIDPVACTIKVSKEAGDGIEAINILFHELFHGLEYSLMLPAMEDEEIDRAAIAVLQLLRDNPWLVEVVRHWKL